MYLVTGVRGSDNDIGFLNITYRNFLMTAPCSSGTFAKMYPQWVSMINSRDKKEYPAT